MSPPDEARSRRPDFLGGPAVRLADGQEWSFPKPMVRIRPRVEGGKVVAVAGSFTFGGDYDRKIEAYHSAADGSEQSVALMGMAVDLLTRNYDLGDDDLADLFTFTVGDEAGDAMRREITEVVLGISPKLFPAGDT